MTAPEAWLLAVADLPCLALFAVLTISFPDLPEVLAVRYDSVSIPEEIREDGALPAAAIVLLAERVERVSAASGCRARRKRNRRTHALWGGAIAVPADVPAARPGQPHHLRAFQSE